MKVYGERVRKTALEGEKAKGREAAARLREEQAPLRQFLFETWKALVRKDRTKPNPRFVFGYPRPEPFIQWSISQGATLGHEVVLHSPSIVENTRDDRHSEAVWETDPNTFMSVLRFEQTDGLYHGAPGEIDPDLWVTDYKLSWMPLTQIARMRPLPTLLGRGRERVREFRKAEKELANKVPRRGPTRLLLYQGREQSASAWAAELGIVSDKVIFKRIASGWSVEAALTAPASKGGRPRKP